MKTIKFTLVITLYLLSICNISKAITLEILDSKTQQAVDFLTIKHKNKIISNDNSHWYIKLNLDSLGITSKDTLTFIANWHSTLKIAVSKLQKDSVIKMKLKKTQIIKVTNKIENNNNFKKIAIKPISPNNKHIIVDENTLRDKFNNEINGNSPQNILNSCEYISSSIKYLNFDDVSILFSNKIISYFQNKDSIGIIKSITMFKNGLTINSFDFNFLLYEPNAIVKIPQKFIIDILASDYKKDLIKVEFKDVKKYINKGIFVGYEIYHLSPVETGFSSNEEINPCMIYQCTSTSNNSFMYFDNKWQSLKLDENQFCFPLIEMEIIVPLE